MTLPTPFLLASTFSDDVHLLLFVITRVNMFCGVVGGDTSPLAKNQAVLATILVPKETANTTPGATSTDTRSNIFFLLDPRVARLPLENFTKSNAVANWVYATTLLNNAMS